MTGYYSCHKTDKKFWDFETWKWSAEQKALFTSLHVQVVMPVMSAVIPVSFGSRLHQFSTYDKSGVWHLQTGDCIQWTTDRRCTLRHSIFVLNLNIPRGLWIGICWKMTVGYPNTRNYKIQHFGVLKWPLVWLFWSKGCQRLDMYKIQLHLINQNISTVRWARPLCVLWVLMWHFMGSNTI